MIAVRTVGGGPSEMTRFVPLKLKLREEVQGRSWVVELETLAPANSELLPQHNPGGIGAPWGQARGCPRKVHILSVASGERMCSNLQACCSISDSLSIARLSVKSRSASRWRRIMLPARSRPRGVSSTISVPSPEDAATGFRASWQGFTNGL